MARRGRAHVTVTGVARLRRRLDELPEEIKQALAAAVQESAEAVRDDVKHNVPVASGRLQRTVKVRSREDGLVADVGWFDRDEYYAYFVEFGTRRAPAQPVLRPALERERAHYRRRLTAEVRAVLR
ncbi:HK97-gp10 family putative phage morphogenesis protein [Streptomyces shenzhenensis]|uniref:HK97-gp10 family putative phage morphogenesis protein n=1 Tax=Streptomyces shenzhenensis TaxID=943815 RepID=UPI003D94F237